MLKDKINFIVALISEFAKEYNLTDAQSFRYLKRYGAIALMEEQYKIMHTLSFRDNVEGLASYCRRKGGLL